MFLITYYGVSFVRSGIDLLQIILKFFDFSFQTLNVLEIGVSNIAGLSFALIIHSDSHCIDYSLKLKLNYKNDLRFYIFSFLPFW